VNRTAVGLLLIVLCAAIEGFAQVSWKMSSKRPDRHWRFIAAGALFYGLEIGLYTFALTLVDVSISFAMGSLSFVSVALLSRVVLKEKISLMRGGGLLLILTGAGLMGGQA
jgi:drug/metabolite transporter (DMT)-like permease